MTPRILPIATLLTLALAACSDGPSPPISPADTSLDPGRESVAPGAEGLYEGDPLAGPDLDPSDDPL